MKVGSWKNAVVQGWPLMVHLQPGDKVVFGLVVAVAGTLQYIHLCSPPGKCIIRSSILSISIIFK
jgi:hypothetical protein